MTGPAAAQDSRDDYVTANLLAIFYHELGHALIDVMGLPVLGQEEDAADTASVLLIDAFYDEEAAQQIARLAAFGFLDEAAADAAAGEEPAWWDEHGPDLQRYYNLVCLFYGADPETRADLAEDLGLPEERAEICPEEYDLAADSWGPILDDLADMDTPHGLRFEGTGKDALSTLIAEEVAAWNSDFSLPQRVTVRIEPCDEANAYYDPGDQSITMCRSLTGHLQALYAQD